MQYTHHKQLFSFFVSFFPFFFCALALRVFSFWYFMTILWCVGVRLFQFSYAVDCEIVCLFHRIFIRFEKLCFVVNLRMCHNFSTFIDFMATHCASYASTNNWTIFHFSSMYLKCVFFLYSILLLCTYVCLSVFLVAYHIVDRCRCTLQH